MALPQLELGLDIQPSTPEVKKPQSQAYLVLCKPELFSLGLLESVQVGLQLQGHHKPPLFHQKPSQSLRISEGTPSSQSLPIPHGSTNGEKILVLSEES
ncbi:hypothetical protein SLE2022_205850 [Rubroshorea leprosula]